MTAKRIAGEGYYYSNSRAGLGMVDGILDWFHLLIGHVEVCHSPGAPSYSPVLLRNPADVKEPHLLTVVDQCWQPAALTAAIRLTSSS